jgi:membrane fusion protein (multidrug efflux system)
VVSIQPLRLELTVPESLIVRVREGLTVDFHVAAFPDRVFSGKIRFIGPSIEMASRALVVEAIVPNEGAELRPGMFATADVVLGARPMPVVPKTAVRTDEATSRVFVDHGNHVEERIVELGRAEEDVVAIAQGLRTGERVVSSIQPGLRDGAPVEAE